MRFLDSRWLYGLDDSRQHALWRHHDRIFHRLPASVRKMLTQERRERSSLHDARLLESHLDIRRGTLALSLAYRPDESVVPPVARAARVDLKFRRIELNEGEALVWRALSRRQGVEWLYEEWNVLDEGLIELRTLWWAERRRRPLSPEYETAVRFHGVTVRRSGKWRPGVLPTAGSRRPGSPPPSRPT